jgi:hypothetical protein
VKAIYQLECKREYKRARIGQEEQNKRQGQCRMPRERTIIER